MKRVLVVLALMTAGLHADLQQTWQAAKKKTGEIGGKIIDPVNFPKYKKLLNAAQDELDACAAEHCSKYKKAKNYDRCVKSKCDAAYKRVIARQEDFKKRAFLFGGLALAGTTLATGAVATAAGVSTLQNQAQLKEIDKIFNENFSGMQMTPEQAEHIKAAIAYRKGYITADNWRKIHAEYIQSVGAISKDTVWDQAYNAIFYS